LPELESSFEKTVKAGIYGQNLIVVSL
jgi:hypothetical protein